MANVRQAYRLGILLAVLLICAMWCVALPSGAAPVTVRLSDPTSRGDGLLGFGVQWEYEGDHPELNVDNSAWLARWPEIERRLDYMRPSLLRVMHNATMYSRMDQGRIVNEYASPRMRATYRILDYAQRRHIAVVFGEWWMPASYIQPFGGVDSPRWADELVVPFVRYLREVKGYTVIRYLNLMNEPAGLTKAPNTPLDFDTWKRAIINLHAALRRAGMDRQIGIVGTDGPGDWNGWLSQAASDPELRGCIAAYEYHLYAHLNGDKWLPSLLQGELQQGELARKVAAVRAADPEGASKPFFMGEAGIDDGNQGDVQTRRGEFEYGVWMADYAAQSLNAGQAGLIAWDLDDAMHTWGSYGAAGLKGWGFWNSLAGSNGYPDTDFALRPWFYTWSLICRAFPRGSTPFAVSPTNDRSVRVAAARLPGRRGISILLVNEANTTKAVSVLCKGAPPIPLLREYRYFEHDRQVDRYGFATPVRTWRSVNLKKGIHVELPAQGVVVLTP